MDLHSLVSALKKMAHEDGEIPKRDSFIGRIGITRTLLENLSGGWTELLKLADLYRPPGYKKPIIRDELTDLRKPPKVLWIDIETAPIEARVWGRWEQNVSMSQITRDWFIMSFAAEMDGVTHQLDQRYSSPVEDDSMLIVAIHHLLNEADVVYTWNGEKFDFKKINARFFKHKLPPVKPYRSIDGLRIAKNKFALTSNKLDDVAKLLGIEGKLHSEKFPGQELWNACLAGNQEAWADMALYNIRDVTVLKEVMRAIDPWHSKVNFIIFEHENKCSCGSLDIANNGVNTTNAGKFSAYRCNDCGRHFQGKTNLIHPETRKELLK